MIDVDEKTLRKTLARCGRQLLPCRRRPDTGGRSARCSGSILKTRAFFGCTPDVDLQPCLQLLGEASSTTRIFFVALVAYYNQQHLKGHLRTT